MREELIGAGMLLVLLGIILIFAGMLGFAIRGGEGKTEVRGGGVVLIGPFPIVFGSDTQSVKLVLLLTLALILVVYLLFYRGWPR
ncbi:TIGR00304 family membrane protein [Candidatus Pyrohabitans sp.]